MLPTILLLYVCLGFSASQLKSGQDLTIPYWSEVGKHVQVGNPCFASLLATCTVFCNGMGWTSGIWKISWFSPSSKLCAIVCAEVSICFKTYTISWNPLEVVKVFKTLLVDDHSGLYSHVLPNILGFRIILQRNPYQPTHVVFFWTAGFLWQSTVDGQKPLLAGHRGAVGAVGDPSGGCLLSSRVDWDKNDVNGVWTGRFLYNVHIYAYVITHV